MSASDPANDPPRLDPADAALAAALAAPGEATATAQTLSLVQMAQRTGLPASVLETLEREGLLLPSLPGDPPRYTDDDVEAVRAGAALLEAGLPLGELLDLARQYDEAMRNVADHAVELFVRFVRDPVQGTARSEDEAAQRLVTAFQTMLPAATTMVAHHLERLLLTRARERLSEAADS